MATAPLSLRLVVGNLEQPQDILAALGTLVMSAWCHGDSIINITVPARTPEPRSLWSGVPPNSAFSCGPCSRCLVSYSRCWDCRLSSSILYDPPALDRPNSKSATEGEYALPHILQPTSAVILTPMSPSCAAQPYC